MPSVLKPSVTFASNFDVCLTLIYISVRTHSRPKAENSSEEKENEPGYFRVTSPVKCISPHDYYQE